jgi:hypothetical protein
VECDVLKNAGSLVVVPFVRVFSYIDVRVLLETGVVMMMMQGGMEHVELQPLQEPVLRYENRGMGYSPEDILLCVDADAEVNVEMKAGGGVKGLSRLDAVKQAVVLFVHSKLLMHPQHRFSVATLSNNAVWVRCGECRIFFPLL